MAQLPCIDLLIMAPYKSPPNLAVAPSPFTMVYIPWGSKDHQIDSPLEKTIILVGPNPPTTRPKFQSKQGSSKGSRYIYTHIYIYLYINTNPGSPSRPNGLPLGRIRNPSHPKERSLLFFASRVYIYMHMQTGRQTLPCIHVLIPV